MVEEILNYFLEVIKILNVKKIGVISDTHGLIRKEINHFFKECDLIIHAGDIVDEEIIFYLNDICRVESVRGNNDYRNEFSNYPDFKEITINNLLRIYVIHDINDMNHKFENYDIIIHGHTHKPEKRYVGKTLILNPGSFGPKRFSLPISLAVIDLENDFDIKFYEI